MKVMSDSQDDLTRQVVAVVDAIFRPEGTLVARGGRHEPAQWAYAQSVARVLCAPGTAPGVGILEAETGLGKSLGYLVPAMAWLALVPRKPAETRRVVVSTFTRTLQRQLVSHDVPLALELLAGEGLLPCQVALRMGRQNFFSPRRVERVLLQLRADPAFALDPKAERQWRRLEQHVSASCTAGSGMLQDWLDDYGAWPPGVTVEALCLLDHMEVDNDAYTRHLEEAKAADLLITNHASLLLMAKGRLGPDLGVDRIVADEAHLLERAADAMGHFRVQIRELDRTGTILDTEYKGLRRGKKLLEVTAALDMLLRQLDPGTTHGLAAPAGAHPISELVEEASGLLEGVATKVLERAGGVPSDEEAEFIATVEAQAGALARWLEPSSFDDPMLEFSEKLRLPSLGVHQHNPAGVVRRLLKDGVRMVVTSGTLASARSSERSYHDLRMALSLNEDLVLCEEHFSPRSYGKLAFVLMSPTCPPPVLKDEDDGEYGLHPRWVAATARMIAEAAGNGPTLVLTLSFREAEALAEALPADIPAVVHAAGTALSECVAQFKAQKGGVLFTPSAWEGLSLHGEDRKQLLKHLVVAHLPFSPTDTGREAYLLYRAERLGQPAALVRAGIYSKQMTVLLHKLKQGLGRAIRGPKDKATIWFADPRFPAPTGQHRLSALRQAIPHRFQAEYQSARVFEAAAPMRATMIL